MNFFKKGIEYNRLAKALNGHYLMLQEIISKSAYEDVTEDLYISAYIGRKEILDRMEKYRWNMNGTIVIPMMPGYSKTLAYAFQQTIGKLTEVAEQHGCLEEVQEVLDKKDLYFELDRTIPDYMKNMM